MINDNNKIDKVFVNYFPNYFKPSEKVNKEEEFIINDSFAKQQEINKNPNLNLDKKARDKNNIKSNVPVNLSMEDNEKVTEVKNSKVFGPTNLPQNIERMYINPRYL